MRFYPVRYDQSIDCAEATEAVGDSMVWRPWRTYNLSMARTESQPQGAEDPDIIDSIPMLGRATTQLERSFGPSCLLSLIMTLLILVVIGRYVQVSWIGRGV